MQLSNEDVIDCLPELIDYVDGQHERLQALVGTTLTSSQIDQVGDYILILCVSVVHLNYFNITCCLPTVVTHIYTQVVFPDLFELASTPKDHQGNFWYFLDTARVPFLAPSHQCEMTKNKLRGIHTIQTNSVLAGLVDY